MKFLRNLYRKVITTEPVVYLDIFKGLVLLGGATGFFVINDAKYQALCVAIPAVLTPLLTWLTRDSVYSQQTVDKVVDGVIDSVRSEKTTTINPSDTII